ncbi:hypothetical protein Pst134EA_029182 [Puccinia striiformis f. sp. tritici]|uniref:hypothetical protein n=2 Tax=Puccinia striiformis f. sp. tritici TaxID=168172 RepID=UPI0020079600|nr:hypothetical protein Pst134EA_029182 [Puccinia striiformis f. sp. tritici]KAH9447140.1 hypothetical protein Pst134EA_029182 [Puccinia striiformis f. sp. tritici]
MTTTTPQLILPSNVAPLYPADTQSHPAKQQQQQQLPPSYHQPLNNQSFHPTTGSPLLDNQAGLPNPSNPSHHNTQLYPLAHRDNPADYTQPSNMMMSQATSHHFDHHLPQQPSHLTQNHHRHVSNASSISSLSSNQSHYDSSQYSQITPGANNYSGPVSYTGSISADAAFGGVPVSADAYHQYPGQHQRSSSTSSSSSPYTEPTSVSEGNSPEGIGAGSNVTGGRKASQIQMMRRARAQASPYGVRTDQVSWNGSDPSAACNTSNLMRSHSVVSDAPSNTEEELTQLLRSQSRESSVSDWNLNPQSGSSGSHHHQTGLGSAGTFMDPYAAVANVHGHSNSYGSASLSMAGAPVNGMGLMMAANGITNTSLVGGMGARMGRMTLDSTETYEALAHHIRTAVTTSASDRARQAFVQAWLNSSYISYTDGNVSRQGLYGSYLRICQQYDIKPINSASFGKSVRQSFPNIKTRRLGVRGNSKYHYCGIRPATAKEADILMNLSQSEKPEPAHNGNNASSAEDDADSDDSPSRRVSLQPSNLSVDDGYQGMMSLEADGQQPQTPRTARPSMSSLASSQPLSHATSDSNGPDFRSPMALPSLDEVLNQPMAQDLDHQKAREFWSMYADHSKNLLESVKSFRFDQFELALRTFWTSLDSPMRDCVTHSLMMSLIYRADAVVYDEILDYLHSQALNQMPQQAFGSLRQLAQNMEQVIIAALENYPSTFVGPKIELAARFGHLVVRNLGICQLAQALSGIFSNPANLKDMAEAWDGIDFEAVRNQAALVTNCQHEILGGCFDEFRAILNNPNVTIDHFISFVEATYKRCLQPNADGERALSPRSLLVRWCFVSSQLIRDLTLRSASSFGSFQIVNLFFDEWLGFKVLRKVALHVAAVAASVDTTSTAQQQSVVYTTESSGQQSNYQGYAAPVNDLLNPGMANSAVDNSDVAHPGTDGFLFSPNTSQAFAIAQQQAHGRLMSPDANSGDQTVVFNPSGGSNSLYGATSDSLGGLHSDESRLTEQSLDQTSRAATHPPQGVTSHSENAGFNDNSFKELMDVSGFSMPSDHSQTGHASETLDSLPQPGDD